MDRRAWRNLAAVLVAAGVFTLVNAWVALRLEVLLANTFVRQYVELDRRVRVSQAREQVKLLVIGNSHAMRGLVPPILADALGMRPDEVFSLAMPATTPFQFELMLRRFLPLFPNVRVVACSVDEMFLTGRNELADRYLTRFSPADRLDYAWRYGESWQHRLSLSLGWAFPVAEFGALLREDIVKARRLPLRRLVVGEAAIGERADSRLWFPWGFPVDLTDWPPRPDEWLRWSRADLRAGDARRAELFRTMDVAAMERGQRELASVIGRCTAAGARPFFVRLPYDTTFEAHLAALPGFRERHRDMLARLRTLGPVYEPQVAWSGPRWFMDRDHLNLFGAREVAVWLAARLREDGLAAALAR